MKKVESQMRKLNILMVTGVYLPEFNGAVLQCDQIVKSLSESFNFTILCSTNDALLAGSDCIEGVRVYRVFMPQYNKFKFLIGAFNFYKYILNSLKKIDLIHIHGYSKRNSIIILIPLKTFSNFCFDAKIPKLNKKLF